MPIRDWLRGLRRRPRPIVGVALGGGLPFGVVATGALAVLEEARIPIDRLAGTSMGAIVAALYAAGQSPAAIEAAFDEHFRRSHLLPMILHDLRLSPYGFFNGDHLMGHLGELIGEDRCFEELRVPLAIPATDIITGEEVIFDRGPVLPAVRASISLPAIFQPLFYQGRFLVDGAVVSPVPIDCVRRLGATFAIAVRAVRTRLELGEVRPHLGPAHGSIQHGPEPRDEEEEEEAAAPAAAEEEEEEAAAARNHTGPHPGRERQTDATQTYPDHPPDLIHTLWRAISVIEQDRFAELITESSDMRICPQLPPDLAGDTQRLHELIAIGRQETARCLPELEARLHARGWVSAQDGGGDIDQAGAKDLS